MSEMTCYLNKTNFNQFHQWLKKHAHTNQRSYPTEKGYYSVSNPVSVNNCNAEISASWVTPDKDNPENSVCYPDAAKVICFQCLVVGERLQVKITHTDNISLLAYVFMVLEEMGKTWPEASKPISEHIEAIKNKYGSEQHVSQNGVKDYGDDIPNFQRLIPITMDLERVSICLYDVLQRLQSERLIYKPEPNIPAGIAWYRIFFRGDSFTEEQEKHLGYIKLIKLAPDITTAEIQYLGGRRYQELFETLLDSWKRQYESYGTIAKMVESRLGVPANAVPTLPPIYGDTLEKVKELSLKGLTVKVIAQRLAISEATVKRYRKKLGLQRKKQ